MSAFLISALFAVFMMFNYIFPLNGILHNRDYILQLWNLWLVNESLINGQSPYFTQLQYYPVGADLGRHVLTPGFFPITFLVWVISGGDPMYPLYTYKIIILISYTLILCFSYLTLRQLGLSKWASAIPAVAYTFSDFYMVHIYRLHIISGFFIPVIAFLLIHLFKEPKLSTVLICAFLWGSGFYFTELTLHICIAVVLVILAMSSYAEGRKLLGDKLHTLGVKALLVSLLVFGLVTSVFAYRWLISDAQPPAAGEAFRYSANLAGFFIPTPPTTPLYGSLFSALNDKISVGVPGYETFVGFPLLFFGCVALFVGKPKWVRVAALLAIIFFVLSLGPSLKVFGLDTHILMPYRLIAAVPPFNVGRTPVRFVAMAVFFWMIVAGYGIQWWQNYLGLKYGQRAAVAGLLWVFVWTTAELYSPIRREQPYVLPAPFEKIVAGPVINLPLKYHDGWAMLPQIFYRQPTATGYVSRNSKKHEAYFETLRVYYAEAVATGSCERFTQMGFRNIVLWPGVPDDVVFGLTHSPHCQMSIVDLRQ